MKLTKAGHELIWSCLRLALKICPRIQSYHKTIFMYYVVADK